MTPQLQTRTRLTAALTIAAALAVSAPAGAEPVDLRSPDARYPQTATTAPGHLLGKHPSARQDLRSPDARDAARKHPSARQDLRSPDARDAARKHPSARQDLRSPDARDAARKDPAPVVPGLPTWPANPVPITPATPHVPIAHGTADTFQWGDAAIGAGGALGFVLLLAGATALVARRHRTASGRPVTP
jgi:hypothetical protein